MGAEKVLGGLERVRRTGVGRWVARCPAHKDRTASLSVRELDDGRVLLHDFAGCSTESVVAALGLRMEDLFPPRAVSSSGRAAEPRPFSARELLNALSSELNVAWIILSDVASGRELDARTRKRAGVARERCAALIDELRHVR